MVSNPRDALEALSIELAEARALVRRSAGQREIEQLLSTLQQIDAKLKLAESSVADGLAIESAKRRFVPPSHAGRFP